MLSKFKTEDLRIREIREVVSPAELHEEFPAGDEVMETVHNARAEIHEILAGRDDRLLVVVGPCSIHDPQAAVEYARRLKELREKLQDRLLIVMRVYFEKPRTTVGWKGLINDPDLDDSFNINKGLRTGRKLLLDINGLGMPAGTEFLDLVTPQYVADLISWGAIGARTTESQVHRELASGLSCPVGFKNGTDGTMGVAIDAIRAASQPHHFLSLTKEGRSAIFSTTGNEDCHIILRGGREPNYDKTSVSHAVADLRTAGLPEILMVDFSHANSRKQYQRQLDVALDVCRQLGEGQRAIVGIMAESHLVEGRQDIVAGKAPVYGQSITDACIGWEDTVSLLTTLADAVTARRRTVGNSEN